MTGPSRPKDGVASARLCPAIHVFAADLSKEDVDARDKPGHDELFELALAARTRLPPADFNPLYAS
jgi:hypothetical protein